MKRMRITIILALIISLLAISVLAKDSQSTVTNRVDSEFYLNHLQKQISLQKEYIQGLQERGLITEEQAEYMYARIAVHEEYLSTIDGDTLANSMNNMMGLHGMMMGQKGMMTQDGMDCEKGMMGGQQGMMNMHGMMNQKGMMGGQQGMMNMQGMMNQKGMMMGNQGMMGGQQGMMSQDGMDCKNGVEGSETVQEVIEASTDCH